MAGEECDGKREHSVSSTIDSRFESQKDSFSEDSECWKEGEEEEVCSDFHGKGWCSRGSKCCFVHEARALPEIRSRRKGVFHTQIL